MPPFLGQGMCSGMRDAANLAWKLAAALHGAPDALLDTYQLEREPHVRTIVELAVGFGRIICTTDAAVATARDEQMLAAAHAEQPPNTPALSEGPAVASGGGTLSVQPWIDGRRFDDVVGPTFALITRKPLGAQNTDAKWWSARAALLDAEAAPTLAPLLGDAEAVVVRPDRYVFGRGSLAALTAHARAVLDALPA